MNLLPFTPITSNTVNREEMIYIERNPKKIYVEVDRTGALFLMAVLFVVSFGLYSFTGEDDTVEAIPVDINTEMFTKVKAISPQEMMKRGAKDYNEAATFLAYYTEVFEANKNVFPNMPEEDAFATFAAIFMSESKDRHINKAGSTSSYIDGYNGCGVKAGSKWKGNVKYTPYWEIENGKRRNYKKGEGGRANAWRQYDSLPEAINDWFAFVGSKRYRKARRARSSEAAIKYLVEAGYATSKKSIDMWTDILTKYDFRNIYIKTKAIKKETDG